MRGCLPILTAGFLSLAGCSDNSGNANQTPLLSVEGHRMETLHSVRYSIEAAPDFSVIGPKHRMAVFSDVPYQISLAAFIRDDAAIMIHAETVADGSGASNYDNLDAAEWPSAEFRSGGTDCFNIILDDLDGEHDPEWLAANGFDPSGNLMLGQYFASSEDYNDEVGISLMLRVAECDQDQANADAYEALQSAVTVSSLD